jgi:hypothetical protein
MGKDSHEITRLMDASGRSLTVLRRQLSTVRALRVPAWAADAEIAASLVPLLFVGAWNSANETDTASLSLLSGDRPYAELEKEIQHLTQLNDAPLWSIGTMRGVVSKIDLLYAIAGSVTAVDLHRFFSMAGIVLGEDDPALDLEESQRWAASLHGKVRKFSGAFREGISETLVLLATHGRSLFKSRLGVDTEVEAARVVRDLLPTPLKLRTLEANDRDLPLYAEAAPDEFLSIIERDLRSEAPTVLALLRPADVSIFGQGTSRTGLLWALENLCWNPTTLPRAALVLARLALVEINDNWVNKPINSLQAVFSAWMPQTAADHQQRVDLVRKLADKFPDVAWKICVAQFDLHGGIGHYSHKPRWRSDGYGFGEPFPTWGPIQQFTREMVKLALSWNHHSLAMLRDLVERLENLADADQARVWGLIEVWAKAGASDADKASLREKIRVSTVRRRKIAHARKEEAPKAAAANAAYAALEPKDLLNKHAWLFREAWVEESAQEIEDIEDVNQHDFREREERIRALRTKALQEIASQTGLPGILELARRGKASSVIGSLAASAVLSRPELQDLLRLALAPIMSGAEDVQANKGLIVGALHAMGDNNQRETLLKSVAGNSEEAMVQLLLLAPFRRSIWKLVDELGEAARDQYWLHARPDWIFDSDDENNEGVERLLKAKRSRAAFSCVRLAPDKVDPELLFRLLSEMPKEGNDKQGDYTVSHHDFEAAFKIVNDCATLTLDQKAGLELAYIEVLSRSWGRGEHYGIPNLERYVERHPEMFVHAVVWAYRRKDGAADPPEFTVAPENTKALAERGYHLLEAIERIPGHDPLGELRSDRLAKWIGTVRQLSAELGRRDIADICIGKVLACAPVGKDGVWPCEPVRDVLEDLQSDSMIQGMHTGVYNSRGAHWRGEGGEQERQLAEKYRKWGESLRVSHPFVSSQILMGLAKTYELEASREDLRADVRRRRR